MATSARRHRLPTFLAPHSRQSSRAAEYSPVSVRISLTPYVVSTTRSGPVSSRLWSRTASEPSQSTAFDPNPFAISASDFRHSGRLPAELSSACQIKIGPPLLGQSRAVRRVVDCDGVGLSALIIFSAGGGRATCPDKPCTFLDAVMDLGVGGMTIEHREWCDDDLGQT
jgi:hypothetical protein